MERLGEVGRMGGTRMIHPADDLAKHWAPSSARQHSQHKAILWRHRDANDEKMRRLLTGRPERIFAYPLGQWPLGIKLPSLATLHKTLDLGIGKRMLRLITTAP